MTDQKILGKERGICAPAEGGQWQTFSGAWKREVELKTAKDRKSLGGGPSIEGGDGKK